MKYSRPPDLSFILKCQPPICLDYMARNAPQQKVAVDLSSFSCAWDGYSYFGIGDTPMQFIVLINTTLFCKDSHKCLSKQKIS